MPAQAVEVVFERRQLWDCWDPVDQVLALLVRSGFAAPGMHPHRCS